MIDKIINSMFVISKKPVLFKDLLEANSGYNEGMLVDPAKLNFKFRYGRSYIIFGLLCFAVFAPLLALMHGFLENIDFHYSVISAILVTAFVFIGFDVFKAYARKRLTLRLIKEAWSVHFPYFPYEKYNETVEKIYNESVKKEIPKRDLEQFVLDNLVKVG